MVVRLRRIAKAGFVNFTRGGLVSFAAVLVMTITLSVMAGLVFLQAVLYSTLSQIEDKVDVTIYFNLSAPEDKITVLQDSLSKLPEVRDVTYTSAEEALAEFRERHKDDYSTLAALDEIGENPLPASLNVRAKEISQYENIANFLKSDNALSQGSASIIDKVNYHQNKLVIDRLYGIINGAEKLGFLLTLILVVISIIVTFNTIRLTIHIAKEEIGVMQLVGASRARVRGPFMVEGAIYGIISTIVTLGLFIPITVWFGRNMTGFLGMNLYDYYVSNFLQVSLTILLAGIALGMISSFIAVRGYLK